MQRTQRLALCIVAIGLASAACGARLSPSQRNEALSYGGGNGSGPSSNQNQGGTTGANSTTTGAVQNGTSGAVQNGTGGTTGSTTGAVSSSATGGGVQAPGNLDWSKMPAGGNGGATDVGITATTITVANVSDISGAVPGLFTDARQAVQAYVKYFNARYPGGIYGRHLVVESLDSQLDTGADRSASIQACNETFAGVGSISAFDQGGAPVIQGCKSAGGVYPDIRGLSTTNQMKAVPNAWPMNVAGAGSQTPLGQYGWLSVKFPQAMQRADYVYSDGEVTRQNAADQEAATKAIFGYNWIDDIPIGTTETNYAPFAQQIANDKATYVTFVGAYQQAANLALALDQIGYMSKITVYMPTVTAYTPDFLHQAGSSVEYGNTYIAMPDAINEEISTNPELGTYYQWLQQVKPGAEPTSLGQFSWAAAALFVKEMIAVGPHPTRGALDALIAGVHSYSPNNMYPAMDVGGRRLQDCVLVINVKSSKFVRYMPASGYRCQDGIFNKTTGKRIPGYPQ